MRDERALRRAGFTEGPRVVLGDGQEWTFPRPWLRLYPVRGEDGRLAVGGGMNYGPEYEDLVDRLVECEPGDTSTRLALQFQMAGLLLERNYELTDRDLRRLLAVDLADPSCEALGADQPGVAGTPPKTFGRWLRHTLIANGIAQDLPWEDAIGVAQMLVALGRAVPPSRWVESLSASCDEAAREALF